MAELMSLSSSVENYAIKPFRYDIHMLECIRYASDQEPVTCTRSRNYHILKIYIRRRNFQFR